MERRFFKEAEIALTVADKEGKIIYMNDLAKITFSKHGDLIGHSLFECHSASSVAKISEMLLEGSTNIYTITKRGVKKIIIQLPWREEGEIKGIMELSLSLPEHLPHFTKE